MTDSFSFIEINILLCSPVKIFSVAKTRQLRKRFLKNSEITSLAVFHLKKMFPCHLKRRVFSHRIPLESCRRNRSLAPLFHRHNCYTSYKCISSAHSFHASASPREKSRSFPFLSSLRGLFSRAVAKSGGREKFSANSSSDLGNC